MLRGTRGKAAKSFPTRHDAGFGKDYDPALPLLPLRYPCERV